MRTDMYVWSAAVEGETYMELKHAGIHVLDVNVIPLDPSLMQDHPPFSITKIGFDCTIPLGGDRHAAAAATVSPPIGQPASAKPLDEAALAERMTALLAEKPRTWYEILQHFAGQPYRRLYRAFGQLRPKLGRREDLAPAFPYTFADTEFTRGDKRPG